MSLNYTESPERRADLRAEVGRLLEADDSRAGAVYRSPGVSVTREVNGAHVGHCPRRYSFAQYSSVTYDCVLPTARSTVA